jgi:hypothetical protein
MFLWSCGGCLLIGMRVAIAQSLNLSFTATPYSPTNIALYSQTPLIRYGVYNDILYITIYTP